MELGQYQIILKLVGQILQLQQYSQLRLSSPSIVQPGNGQSYGQHNAAMKSAAGNLNERCKAKMIGNAIGGSGAIQNEKPQGKCQDLQCNFFLPVGSYRMCVGGNELGTLKPPLPKVFCSLLMNMVIFGHLTNPHIESSTSCAQERSMGDVTGMAPQINRSK